MKDPAPINSSHVLVLGPGRSEHHYWRDVWAYRDLFAILAWRDLAVRYKQTVIGVAWAIIRPLAAMLVFTVLFGKLVALPTDGDTPYAILVLAGMLPWFLFSSILSAASNSVVGSAGLISKVYFPRIIIPGASTAVPFADFAVNLGLLAILMGWYGHAPGWQILLLPAFVGLAALAGLGPALLLSALNVKYRDFTFVTPFVVQLGLYISPVGYSSSIVPAEWRFWYSLNPVVGVIDGFRWSLLGSPVVYPPALTICVITTAVLLCLGVIHFRRTERTFADLV